MGSSGGATANLTQFSFTADQEPASPVCRGVMARGQATQALASLPHCLTKFSSPSTRDAHARAVHEKWRDYKCPHCSSLFAGKGDMVRHCRVVHERRRDHQCPHCSSRFSAASHMRRHCTTVHERCAGARVPAGHTTASAYDCASHALAEPQALSFCVSTSD